MAVDLTDAIPSFLNYLNPVGQSLYNPSTTESLQRLTDAFWTLRLSGLDFLNQWTCSEGLITPQGNPSGPPNRYIPPQWYTDIANSTDPGQEIVQAICLFAAYQALNAQLMNLKTQFSARAGAVAYESQQSSAMLVAVQKAFKAQIDIVLTRLSDLGFTVVGVTDSVIQMSEIISEGGMGFTRGSYYDNGGRPW